MRSSKATTDLHQLWRRIVFSILISNTDDHLRNHAFLHDGRRRLAALSRVRRQPEPRTGTQASEHGHRPRATTRASISLALSVADYFRLGAEAANDVVVHVQAVVSQWATVARQYGLSGQEVSKMSWAFEAHSARPHP
jgi:serine/threonine-protein kinase HipA